MNTKQRLFSNTLLAFLANIMVKASNALLFIVIGRKLGATEAGIFNLGITFYTIALALSNIGLHEMLTLEVAARRDQSTKFLLNFILIRLVFALFSYGTILFLLNTWLPYSADVQQVIRILTLAIFPEAILLLCQALFAAHEYLLPVTIVSAAHGTFKLGVGLWVLSKGGDAQSLAWVMLMGSTFALLLCIVPLIKLLHRTDQVASRLSWRFIWNQLIATPGFVLISVVSTIDYQLDALLISLLLSVEDLGWFGGAQTIMLGFWMIPVAVRTAIYPVMARYYRHGDQSRLVELYRQVNRYLIIGVLPIAAGVMLLARPIVELVFGNGFLPTVRTLQIMIWAIVWAFLLVPNARLMLAAGKQADAGLFTTVGMVANILLNIILIPRYGIAGAALARVLASLAFFAPMYLYVQRRILKSPLSGIIFRPVLATLLMTGVVYPLRNYPMYISIAAGVCSYTIALLLTGALTADEFRQIFTIYRTNRHI